MVTGHRVSQHPGSDRSPLEHQRRRHPYRRHAECQNRCRMRGATTISELPEFLSHKPFLPSVFPVFTNSSSQPGPQAIGTTGVLDSVLGTIETPHGRRIRYLVSLAECIGNSVF